jgi:thiol:disulfide interchange protein DsbD
MISNACHQPLKNLILPYNRILGNIIMLKLTMQKIFTVLLCLLITGIVKAQDANPTITTSVKDISGTEKIVQIKGVAATGTKLISIKPNGAEVNTTISFDSSNTKYLKDSVTEIGTPTIIKGDGYTEFKINGYDSVIWEQKVQLQPNDSIRVKANVEYYYQAKDGTIGSGNEKLSKQIFTISSNSSGPNDIVNSKPDFKYKSLWALFIGGLLAGFIGFLTPCVYSLVPVTVSMFLKRSKTPAEGKRNVFTYAFFIILIFTLVGALTGTLFSTSQLQGLATHWLFNLFIFVLFVIFGISFLGAFDITLPSSWANALDKKANSKSFGGIFFMAIVMVLVSFSCTSIFVTNILTNASIYFGRIGPVLGMFAFGLGLGLPFIILALFPKFLTTLTKSGGWQNVLKVTLGFIELALALKFLSNVDVYFKWRILDREVFLVLWIVLFVLLGIYLLGKLAFSHDSGLPKNDWDIPYLPLPRLFFAIASFAFAMYLVPGLWGAPLKAVSAFVPAMGTQDFILTRGSGTIAEPSSTNTSNAILPSKYVSILKQNEPLVAIENNLTIYYDYDEALAAAKILKKPLLLDFTGEQCVNCRKFEAAIWPNAEVLQRMKNDFVIASLFTDAKIELNDVEKVYDSTAKVTLNTVGDKFKALQLKLIRTEAQPNYVFVDNQGNLLHNEGYGYEPSESASAFVKHLEMVKMEFKKRNP